MATTGLKFTVADRVVYDEGTYEIAIVDYAAAEGKFGLQCKWALELVDVEREDGKPARVSYFTSLSISPKSKLGKMFLALGLALPETQEEAEEWEPDLLLGKRCRARLVHGMGSDGQVYSNVDELLPLVKKTKAGAVVKKKVEEPETDEGAVEDLFADQ